MGFKLEDEVVEAAVDAPKVFVEASLGEDGQYNREPGIQLTKEQIISLRKYEVLGLSLPYRINDVVAYLNYGAGDTGGPGLRAMDFLDTFTATYDHARRWSPLREQIQLTGAELEGFANVIIQYGDSLDEVYREHKSSGYLEEHDINTVEDYLRLQLDLPHLPRVELSSGDTQDIEYYLNQILIGVRSRQARAQAVRSALDSFGTDMRELVLPKIKVRLKAVSENTYEKQVQDIQEEIDQRADEIDELNKQYADMVKEAIVAAATLNIGGLILGIYQGVQAEKLRKRRNELKDAQDGAIQKLGSKNQTLSSLNRVRGDLQNLSSVTIEAEAATQNLMLVWSALSQYIEDSLNQVDKVRDAPTLRSFNNTLKAVVRPWRQDISLASKALNAIFEEAQREIDADNFIKGRMTEMYSISDDLDYPSVNITAMVGYNSDVQRFRTQTQHLADRHDYLPDVVDRMIKLATAINGKTYALRVSTQTAKIALEAADEALKDYQEEFEDADTDGLKQEIRADMEKSLREVFRKISEQAIELKEIQLNLSVRYDRDASKQWVIALEKDREFAEEQKNRAEAKRAELVVRMKEVSDAIDLLGRSGIERIGQEAQLTAERLMEMALTPPQLQIAVEAMKILKKAIAGLGETLSYLNMVAGYNTLTERASELRVQVENSSREISAAQGKIDLVESMDGLDGVRWDYIKEFSNVVAAFEIFSSVFEREETLPVEDHVSNARAVIPGILRYLRPLYQQ
ncbi:alpha-xenorhabdolysin family binary toxin subunit A [Pseudomonas sp. SWRI92]|nr:alpha-xenorhabdolysin family binary toxin subunit A [Pseudomonas sp. SWRI92]